MMGGLNYAGFGPRLIAALIDGAILGAINLIFVAVIAVAVILPTSRGEQPGPMAMAVTGICGLLMAVIGLGYNLFFVGTKGATPGKKMMKLRVALVDGTVPIGMGKAFVRMIGQSIGGSICGFGYWMILWDKQCRGLHDKIAGTIVIKV